MIKNLLNVVEDNTSIEITISKSENGLTKITSKIKTANAVLNRKIKPIEFFVTQNTVEMYLEIMENTLKSVLPLISAIEAPEKPKQKRGSKKDETANVVKGDDPDKINGGKQVADKKQDSGVTVNELENDKLPEGTNLEDNEQW